MHVIMLINNIDLFYLLSVARIFCRFAVDKEDAKAIKFDMASLTHLGPEQNTPQMYFQFDHDVPYDKESES